MYRLIISIWLVWANMAYAEDPVVRQFIVNKLENGSNYPQMLKKLGMTHTELKEALEITAHPVNEKALAGVFDGTFSIIESSIKGNGSIINFDRYIYGQKDRAKEMIPFPVADTTLWSLSRFLNPAFKITDRSSVLKLLNALKALGLPSAGQFDSALKIKQYRIHIWHIVIGPSARHNRGYILILNDQNRIRELKYSQRLP